MLSPSFVVGVLFVFDSRNDTKCATTSGLVGGTRFLPTSQGGKKSRSDRLDSGSSGLDRWTCGGFA